jgi:hypothetical protein
MHAPRPWSTIARGGDAARGARWRGGHDGAAGTTARREMGGGWCVLATAMLTLFYHGLLDLAKVKG